MWQEISISDADTTKNFHYLLKFALPFCFSHVVSTLIKQVPDICDNEKYHLMK